MRLVRVVTLGVVMFMFACSTKPSESGSCFRPQENVCIDYAAAQAAAGKRLCAGLQWNAAPCRAEQRLGTCAKTDVSEVYYAGAPNNYDAAGAKLACEHASGSWK